MISDRERFLSLVFTQPRRNGDAVVVLTGEDSAPRLDVGFEIFRMGWAPRIVLSGGKHAPPRIQSAESLVPALLAKGVSSERIIVESESQNTHEQAVNVLAMAQTHEWERIILVASSYHLPRAVLSFLATIGNSDGVLGYDVQIVPVAASHSPWFGSPAGTTMARRDLLDLELAKIDAHQKAGHAASYEAGIAALRRWEART